jgi:hypothetical protein
VYCTYVIFRGLWGLGGLIGDLIEV